VLTETISASIRQVVPWFHETMPEAYFRQVSPARREKHLRTVATLSVEGIQVPEVQLQDDSGFTFISSADDGSLKLNQKVMQQLDKLPASSSVRRVLLFQSKDGQLGLNVFDTNEGHRRHFGSLDAKVARQKDEAAALVPIRGYLDSPGEQQPDFELLASQGPALPDGAAALSLEDFLARCPSSYVISHTSTPWLLHDQRQLYERVAGGEDIAVALSRYPAGGAGACMGSAFGEAGAENEHALLTMAIPRTPARAAISRAILLLNLHGMELQRAQVDVLADGDDSTVTLLRTVIRPLEGSVAEVGPQLVADAARLKWCSDFSFGLAHRSQGMLSLAEAEVALGLADLSLALLDHPLLSRTRCRERLNAEGVQPIVAQLVKSFTARFDPDRGRGMGESDYQEALAQALRDIEAGSVGDEQSKQLLRAMISAASHTLRTNVHVDGRWALSLRLDPRFFEPVLPPVAAGFSNLPYGTIFVAGRFFNGFHNRFRDIARGGLRVVLPPSEEAHSAESRRHFMECFGLSWAQQLKNKDIPEGGAKAVCLVRPQPDHNRADLMHGCVKRMSDAILDLIVPTTAEQLVTRATSGLPPLGDEFIYLGPDENITPKDLDWIVERAAVRGYPMPSAFMSSKPRAGINHKEFGVTSEGVAVFLGEALRAIGIRPTEEAWTIKLTGGPDGDVAGNMLKILHRDYGANVRVVGMADGSAAAEDPDGLPMTELLRLFEQSLPLSELGDSLGPNGLLTLADTPAGVAARNTMHNRVVADAFVPAGGRPATMNGSNWRDFLLPDGRPSARVVVEGANLFLTPEARLALFEATGLPIVKDSSANKCGVICSSMEIRASMCVTDDEFVALKPRYVEEVLSRLREMAQLEASLLFAEAVRDASTPLPQLSERISFAILRVSDALAKLMDSYSEGRQLWPLVCEQLPAALAASAHAPALPQRLPWEYQKSTIVKSLASRLVYREGLPFVETMSDARLPAFALAYLEQEQRVCALADAVGQSGEAFAPQVKSLLLKGGVRAAAEMAAGSSGV